MSGDARDAGLRALSTVVAIVVNGGLFAGMALAGMITAEEEPEKPEIIEIEQFEIVQKGQPRDPKLLPRIPTSPAPLPPEEKAVNVAPKPPEPEAPKPPDPEELKVQREREEKERQKKEAEERRLREEEKKKRKAAMDRALERIGEDDPPEGSPDGMDGGNTTDPTKSNAFLGYIGQLTLMLQRSFEAPATIAPDELKRLTCEVTFQLGEDGKVKGEPTIARPSGNRFFDDAALRAVRKFGAGTPDKLPLPTEPNLRKVVLKSPIRAKMRGA